jgi:glycosyltransferase involved in cell wall biosynthesis
VQLFFRAADFVVLPYRDILNSGAALLALSFNRPVLVPNQGAMGELQSSAGAEWVRIYSGDIDAAQLVDGLAWAVASERPREVRLDHLEWPRLAEQTLHAYEEIRSPRARPREVVASSQGRTLQVLAAPDVPPVLGRAARVDQSQHEHEPTF